MRPTFRTRDFDPDPENDLREEIEAHIDEKTEELMAQGLPRREARAEAERRFGDREKFQSNAAHFARRRARRAAWLTVPGTFSQDMRYAIRSLRRAPGMTALTLLILALGIGANTAVFSILNAVFLEPIPLPQPEELAFVWNRNIRDGGTGPASFPNYLDWQEQNTVFQAMGAFGGQDLNLTGDGDATRIRGARVTASVFDVLGVPPLLGRTLLPEEEVSDQRVVVLSHRLWNERFDADADIVGRPIQIDETPYTVVGVMPEGFVHPTPWGMGDPYLAWVPISDEERLHIRDANSFQVIARLNPLGSGTRSLRESLRAAEVNLFQIGDRLAEAYPETNEEWRSRVVPLHLLLYGEAGFAVLMVLGAAGLVLLIACGNIAAFLLARATTRQAEMGIRASLGASRGRIVRQLLTESAILALAGGLLAVLLASWSLDLLKSLIPASIPRAGNVELDGGVLLFALLVSLLTGLIFGLAPALSAARMDVTAALKGTGARDRRLWKRMKSQHAFVTGQFALGIILAHLGLLLIQSYAALRATEQGFDEDHTLTMALSLGGSRYETGEERGAFLQELLPHLRAVPGVERAGVTTKLPLMGGTNSNAKSEETHSAAPDHRGYLTEVSSVSGDYFGAMGIPLLAGGAILPEDPEEPGTAVVVNETLARRFWGEDDPLGKRFGFGRSPSQWLTVVGVVGDVRQAGFESIPRPEAYYPYSFRPQSRLFIPAALQWQSSE